MMHLTLGVLVFVSVTGFGVDHGTCGYECTADTDCENCGSAGFCSCPLGQDDLGRVPSVAASTCACSSKPAAVPVEPKANVALSRWPEQWTASVEALVYGDYAHNATISVGKFWFDSTIQSQKTVWIVNRGTNSSTTQVWIGDVATTSYYWVLANGVCVGIPMTDPGIAGAPPVGIEVPDWMERCDAKGYAQYVGREVVDGVWADHYVCHIDYEHLDGVREGITFQNFHSLGLSGVPAGLPVRVTGGNTHPDPQQSPRLSTVFYHDFCAGSSCTNSDDFSKPSPACIPIGDTEAEAFFGYKPQHRHAHLPEFHHRAHFLPFAKPGVQDLMRAKQPKPGQGFTGATFAATMGILNDILKRETGLMTRMCQDFSLPELHAMQRLLFDARTLELDQVYQEVGDARRMAHGDARALLSEQAQVAVLDGEAMAMARDGACHEMVMWFIHHLSSSAREEIKGALVLPLLPEVRRERGGTSELDTRRYEQQVSCGLCHVAPGDARPQIAPSIAEPLVVTLCAVSAAGLLLVAASATKQRALSRRDRAPAASEAVGQSLQPVMSS